MSTTKNKELIEDGYRRLALSIIEKAVHDFNELKKSGLIVNGEALREWPADKFAPHSGAVQYRYPYQSIELVRYFTSGEASATLDLINANVNAEAMMQALGLKLEKGS